MSTESREPFLTVLNYSGGSQSSYLLKLVLEGKIERPFRFVVMQADPGMEQEGSIWTVLKYRQKCREQGIDIITATGPSLFNDLVSLPSTGARRIDNPPFWTRNKDGTRGRLRQKCTDHYKIAPMDRAVRQYLKNKYGIRGGSSLRPGLVQKWIGFAADEWHRCSDSSTAYVTFRFPLIELGLTKQQVVEGFGQFQEESPDRSVCSACPWNGLNFFKKMYDERPLNWAQAVEVDNSLEGWPKIGVAESECFVSSSLIRLRDLPSMNFGAEDPDMTEHHCNSGVCFL